MSVKNIKARLSICLFLVLFLPGCSSYSYRKLALPTAETYPRNRCPHHCANIRQIKWPCFFNDPALQKLLFLALKNNRELRTERQTQESYRTAYHHLLKQVADIYLIDCELNELIGVTLSAITSYQESYHIMKLRFDDGAAPKFEFLQAESLLLEAQVDLTTLQRKRELNWNEMTLLVGVPVCSQDLLISQIEPYFLREICPGFPSELLYARPDVLAARQKLWAARSSLIPSKARSCLAAADYERVIQVAFRDVADALAERSWFEEQVLLQATLLAAQTERAELARIRFLCSNAPYLEVIDAEREKFLAAQTLVQVKRAFLSSGIHLYIALGGGYCK